MKTLIEANAEKVRELNAAIKRTWRQRNDSPSKMTVWKEACRLFHTSYDALAFPGGLQSGMSLLEKNDVVAIQTTIEFLEVDPYFFRSGYLKAEMLKRLRLCTPQRSPARPPSKCHPGSRWEPRDAKRVPLVRTSGAKGHRPGL
jgi:hypothetical protein